MNIPRLPHIASAVAATLALAAAAPANGNHAINQVLDVDTSVLKALHLSSGPSATAFDAQITFSSNFAFDFNPRDGIQSGTYDFTAVAVHELGHALGFVSGIDFFGHPNGPGAALFDDLNLDDFAVGSTLDLFRYGNGFNPDGSRQLQWSPDRSAFFSVDGGATVFNLSNDAQQAAYFARGQFNGDGFQASAGLVLLGSTARRRRRRQVFLTRDTAASTLGFPSLAASRQ
ncbi:MAG: NF038122 family metalloprotease [Sphingomonadaceae bacterium]